MKPINPLWGPERHQAYTEVSLIICAKDKDEFITARSIVRQLGSDALSYVRRLPCGPDETFHDTFERRLVDDGVIFYDPSQGQYCLGPAGDLLVINYLDELAG